LDENGNSVTVTLSPWLSAYRGAR